MHVWDAVQKMGAKTAYVSLMALNELGLHPNATCAEDTFDNMVRMLDKIKEVNPGINIVVLSNTYMVNTFNYKNRSRLTVILKPATALTQTPTAVTAATSSRSATIRGWLCSVTTHTLCKTADTRISKSCPSRKRTNFKQEKIL